MKIHWIFRVVSLFNYQGSFFVTLSSDFAILAHSILNVKHFFKKFLEFSNFRNCLSFSNNLLESAFVSYHRVSDLSTTFLIFFKKVFGDFSPKQWNGERGIWTLAPLLTTYSLSRGAPSAAWVFLQIAKLDNSIPLRNCNQLFKAESVGFEPTVPFGITGFQDQLLKPLGQLSEQCLIILSRKKRNVKHFFVFF